MKFKPHHTAFTVKDLDESVKWYKEMLGFKITHEYKKHGGGRALIELGDVRIEFFDFGEETILLPDYRKELIEDLHVQGVKLLYIEVENLDHMVKLLNKKGVETQEIDKAGFGCRYTFFKD